MLNTFIDNTSLPFLVLQHTHLYCYVNIRIFINISIYASLLVYQNANKDINQRRYTRIIIPYQRTHLRFISTYVSYITLYMIYIGVSAYDKK